MKLTSFLLAASSLALLGRADAKKADKGGKEGADDFKCEALNEKCTGYGSQGSCCGGYTCEGNKWSAQCKVDPSLDRSDCIDVWGNGCDNDKEGGCCLGNYCSIESWGSTCKPNPRDTDCSKKNKGPSPAKAPSTKAPSRSTASSTKAPNPATATTLSDVGEGVCLSPNLGDAFSGPTGKNAYSENWPKIGSTNWPKGRDDSVAFFVGGDYYGKTGAEVEGKMVVLGNLKNNGINSMVQVGLGSQIIPNNDQDVILVGGNFENNYGGLVVMQNTNKVKGNIVYKGKKKGDAKIWTNGDIRKDSTLDLSEYEDNLEELKVKSHYWSTLKANGEFIPYYEGPNENTAVFKAGDNNCVQVFNLGNDRFSDLPWGINVQFHPNLKDKTVLINMNSGSDKRAKVTNLANFFDPWDKGHWDFDSGFIGNILWNFHDATYVDLGGGTTGTGEFIGSIIVPNGDLKMGFPGQSGRTIVGGDLTQDRAGSEFHSYPYDPVCALPLPLCGGSQGPLTKALTPGPTKAPTPRPTPAPTPRPTKAPTPEPTKAPTPDPTMAPTPQPSKAPTPGPTARSTKPPVTKAPTSGPTPAPTPAPTPVGASGCGSSGGHPGHTPLGGPSTVTVGLSQPHDNLIVVGEQKNCSDIDFGLTNQWGTNIDYIFVQYTDLENGLPVCEAFKDVSTSWFATFSAKCRRHAAISIVTVTAIDSSFSTSGASLLECCGDNEILGEIRGTDANKVVLSKYVLECCPEKVAYV
jgi:choice-of-anchor A domain-containing protein